MGTIISELIAKCQDRGLEFTIFGQPFEPDPTSKSLEWRYRVEAGDAETDFHIGVHCRDLAEACARASHALESSRHH